MAGLFTMAVTRNPKPGPAGLAEQASIHTHPPRGPNSSTPLSAIHRALAAPAEATDATPADIPRKRKGSGASAPPPGPGAPSPLHDRLFAAWSSKDWVTLAATARHHLTGHGPAPQLRPITAAAVEFFRPWAMDLQAGDTERFLRSFPEGILRAYLAGEVEQERNHLADDALALQCLGMLGQAPFDYAEALRAIEALTVCAQLWDLGADELGISIDLVRQIGEMDVFLPCWSFEIDVCRHSDSADGWPGESPLEQKIVRAARRNAGTRNDAECECTPGEPDCEPQNPCCANVHYYVAELLELRDWTHRYKPGDIAYIENIAAGEKRSREHEMKRTREIFSETEITDRQSETRDFQVSDRSNLKREIERQKENSLSGEASATGSYDAKVYSASVSASVSFAKSSSEAIREAQENAIETVKKAVSEIEKQTRTKRSEKITTEETEKNLHAFENGTDEAFVSKYFWVTKECRAQLYSYGKQMIAEFIVPEPARLYGALMERRREAEIAKRIKAPGGLTEAPVLDLAPGNINQNNYKDLAATWQVKIVPAWPPPTIDLSQGAVEPKLQPNNDLAPLHFDIPDGYEASQMMLSGQAKYLSFFGFIKNVTATGMGAFLILPASGYITPRATGSQDVGIHATLAYDINVTLTLHLERKPGALEAWQKTVFDLIQANYEKAAAAYGEYEAERDKLRRELMEAEEPRHPFFNREIERTELKRAVIYLMCQDFSVDGAMIRKAEPCGFPEIDRTATDKKGYDWYFWDRLIDWKQMAYAFFDYFWNPVCDWPQRFDPADPDALFKAFQRAGYARVLVPVSPAMHKDFLWYLTTHEKWNHKGPPFGDQDPRWRNVVFELKQANEAAMTRREGHVDVANGSPAATIKGSDRYWSAAGTGLVDPAMIALDIDREIYIDGEVYLIVAIAFNGGSPVYNPLVPNSGWWDITLDRAYAGPTGTGQLYAMGAQAVAPAFSFDMPTELIWAGDKGKCLPTYPLPPCVP
jgi:hypothetical protein